MDWESIKDLIANYGYYAVAVGTMWDQSGLQGFVIAGGVLASVTGHLNPWLVALCGAAGSFASDLLLFSIGRWRARWLERFARSPKGAMRLTMLQEGMKRWGWALLTLGRFMPWMGRFVPAAAGLRHYPVVPALLFTVLGSLVSGLMFAALGFYAAESMKWLDQYMLYIGLGALVISVPVAVWMLKRFDRMVEKRMTMPPPGQPGA